MKLPQEALFSTAGRILARSLEAQQVAGWMSDFYDSLLGNIRMGDERMFVNDKWQPASWPEAASGVCLTEAPRGALAHYATVRDKRVANYQMVMPTTWHAGPRPRDSARDLAHRPQLRPLPGVRRASLRREGLVCASGRNQVNQLLISLRYDSASRRPARSLRMATPRAYLPLD
jgi:hypothetical protein